MVDDESVDRSPPDPVQRRSYFWTLSISILDLRYTASVHELFGVLWSSDHSQFSTEIPCYTLVSISAYGVYTVLEEPLRSCLRAMFRCTSG